MIKKIENYRQLVQKHFIKTKSENFIEQIPKYGQFFKTKLRGKNYWFAIPKDFDFSNTKKIYQERTICESLYEPAHFAEFTINLKEGTNFQDNFIYWDDIEWGYKCHLAGYDIVSCQNSQVLHQQGANKEAENTFPTYYAWRNWIVFFLQHIEEIQL